jgi:purine-nucleoside phosphorylase
MYRQVPPKEYRKHFNLPEDYSVSGFLCHGSWKREEEIENIRQALTELKIKFEINELLGFLRRMIEIKIEGKNYWFDVPYGSAMLSEYLQLACLLGSKKNILVGSCGGLSPEVNACDVIIPTWSYGNESSTRMYSQQNKDNHHYPNNNLTANLKSKLPGTLKVTEGPTMTCQAMLGQSWDDVQTWSKDGYFGVEMEASTVFAVSNHFKVPSAALLVVGDNLIKEETTMHENFEKLANKRVEIRQEFLKAAFREFLS